MKYFWCFLFPPLGVVYSGAKSMHIALNGILLLFGWIPGMAHALLLCIQCDVQTGKLTELTDKYR